ncbi:MAG TPA: ABC transporter permease [Candidatus Eisenbergiella pullicola]|nr:ABC transporter permease [Candidatus Eisenbergiella pullicola]
MADHIRSKRFLIVLCLILLTSCASVYGAVSVLSDAVASDPDYIFLKLFTLSGNSIPSFTSFIALLGPFVGLTLGFDAINSERSEGTLNRLVSQPIYRDCIINGKFLAGATVIFLMVFSMGLVIGAVGLLTVGIPPTVDEVGRVVALLFFTSVYICFWLALSILFSVLCRHAATSAMIVIALWIFFALFMSLVVNIVTNALYPSDQVSTVGQVLDYYECQLALNRLSPYYLYSEAISTIMDPTVRSMNVILPQQLSGAISGYLSAGQSLLLVWPHLVGLLALTAVVFALSYISFMRREIRSR